MAEVNSLEEFAERSALLIEQERQQRAEYEQKVRDAEIAQAMLRMGLVPNGQQPASPPSQAHPTQDANWWNPPQVNLELVRKFRTKDAAGEETWKPGTPADVVAQYEAYEAYHDQWVDKLARNPVEAFKPLEERLLARAKAEALAELEAKYATVQSEQKQAETLDRIRRENEAWLFQKDPITNRPRTGPDGNYLMTPDGIEAQQTFQHFVSDLKMPVDEAWNLVQIQREYKQLKAGQAAFTGQQVAQQKKDDFLLNAARGTPNAAGTLTAASHPGAGSQNPNLSLREKLKQQMLQDGTHPVQS